MSSLRHLLVLLVGALLLAFAALTGGACTTAVAAETCCCAGLCTCRHAPAGVPACSCSEGMPAPVAPAVPPTEVPIPQSTVGSLREEKPQSQPGALAQRYSHDRADGSTEPRFGNDVRQGRRRHGVLSIWRE